LSLNNETYTEYANKTKGEHKNYSIKRNIICKGYPSFCLGCKFLVSLMCQPATQHTIFQSTHTQA